MNRKKAPHKWIKLRILYKKSKWIQTILNIHKVLLSSVNNSGLGCNLNYTIK